MRFLLTLLILACWPSHAQSPGAAPQAGAAQNNLPTFWDRFWVSVQANFISQYHPAFAAAYSGPNSFAPPAQDATSRVFTLYTGFRISNRLEILADVESVGGAGLSNALGIAGFTNVDVVRNPSLSQDPYLARAMLHYTIPLGRQFTEATRNPLSLASTVPVRRLELRAGKLSTVDFFDLNSVGSDSHLQFMNWTAVNNGAYDYAADTRGYTYGVVAEFYDGQWAARFGEMLMPTVANGPVLDWDVARARGENYEVEYHPQWIGKRSSAIRALAYENHARMGLYRDAIDSYLAGRDAVPDIVLSRKPGRIKYGFGLNAEQELTPLWRAFFRLGWNDGRTESFAYTEVDRTAAAGSDFRGTPWHRSQDKVGVAVVANGISGDHRRYLQLGGVGFILGDGGLRYGLEKIFETYYTAHLWRGISLACDYQHVTDPGYNRDRGPVSVVGLRLHIEDSVPFDKFGRH